METLPPEVRAVIFQQLTIKQCFISQCVCHSWCTEVWLAQTELNLAFLARNFFNPWPPRPNPFYPTKFGKGQVFDLKLPLVAVTDLSEVVATFPNLVRLIFYHWECCLALSP